MLMRLLKMPLILTLAIFLAACAGEATEPIATATMVATVPPSPVSLPTLVSTPFSLPPGATIAGELLRLSGNAPFTSTPFRLESKTFLRVYWRQASQGKFQLSIVNLDQSQMGTPYGKVTFESTAGPSSFWGDYEFIAGDYVVSVENADGPWEIWIQVINLNK